MSRERATAAPTGLKTIYTTYLHAAKTATSNSWRVFSNGNKLILLALRQLGLHLFLL